jgi:hypothetical protein
MCFLKLSIMYHFAAAAGWGWSNKKPLHQQP